MPPPDLQTTFLGKKLLGHQTYLTFAAKLTMTSEINGPPSKRQKREVYRKANQVEASTNLPKKKFYRQRAHANPFSDHQLA